MGQTLSNNATNNLAERGSLEQVWEKIDEEVLLKIFSFLNVVDLCNTAKVSRLFKKASEDNALWQPLYENAFSPIFIDEESNQSYKYWYRIEVVGLAQNKKILHEKSKKSFLCCGIGSNDRQLQHAAPGLRVLNNARLTYLSPKQRLHEGIKLVLLGDTSAGKTSIIARFCRNIFLPFHEATIGASFLVKQVVVENTPVRLQIWDTAGSERFFSLAPMYYRGAAAAIIVYDLTNSESFEKAQRWLSELQNQPPPLPIIALAGNKADLIETRGRQVKSEMARNCAEDNDLIFLETSAKTGANVPQVFLAIAKKLKEQAEKQEEEENMENYSNSFRN